MSNWKSSSVLLGLEEMRDDEKMVNCETDMWSHEMVNEMKKKNHSTKKHKEEEKRNPKKTNKFIFKIILNFFNPILLIIFITIIYHKMMFE